MSHMFTDRLEVFCYRLARIEPCILNKALSFESWGILDDEGGELLTPWITNCGATRLRKNNE